MAADVLNAKQEAFAKVAAYAARGNQKGLKESLIEGLDAGITVNELKEVLVQVYAYCGFPRSLNALQTLMQLEIERGNADNAGIAAVLPSDFDSLREGTANQTKLVGAAVKGEIFAFAPAIDKYLKAHLFGDIFARDTIDWQTRELATVAMLAARSGVDAQLQSHIQIAKYNGITDEQVKQIIEIADATGVDDLLFGRGAKNPYSQYFSGKSYLQPITPDNGVPMFNVTFEPKCRNNWHIHHKSGQILLVTSGRGWYQEWGKEPRELKVGDVVNIAPEVKHWHGAAKNSWFTHIAVEVPAENSSNEWLEPVSDEEYDRLP